MSGGIYQKSAESYRLSAIFNTAFGILFLLIWLALQNGYFVTPTDTPPFPMFSTWLPTNYMPLVLGIACLCQGAYSFYKSRRCTDS